MFSLPLTDRASLHPLEPWQAEEFAAFVERARPHLAPWLPWARSITDVAGARGFLTRYADGQAGDIRRIYAIRSDGEMVGGTLFRVFDVDQGVCEIGVWLAPEASGQGLVTRAVRIMIDWAFRDRGMHRVEWRVVPHNEPSRAVARRLGMTREGVLRQSFLFGGERLDVEVWSLLAPEWPVTTG
ncbi:GNAT family N-acetyltransferase [Micromonospora cathayae]|uniref:GNAT family protein n=1 Tax=Micromonospora cathayae TaxID=3028804 RepID=A0ABY7ZQ13_9ACTN|nr:GNAT family protein [Micromonospora sp. HUAS 3]WDZ84158.1 GNAT family protein [Micromonospora sp. HUAS 3]